jgi:hypothetical protein
VLYIATAVEHQGFEAFLGQFFGSPTTTYACANHNGIKAAFFGTVYVKV